MPGEYEESASSQRTIASFLMHSYSNLGCWISLLKMSASIILYYTVLYYIIYQIIYYIILYYIYAAQQQTVLI